MPTNDELTALMVRVHALEAQVAALDGRVRQTELENASQTTSIQLLQGAIATTVNDLIASRDRVTDRLFQAVDVTAKAPASTSTGSLP